MYFVAADLLVYKNIKIYDYGKKKKNSITEATVTINSRYVSSNSSLGRRMIAAAHTRPEAMMIRVSVTRFWYAKECFSETTLST